MSFRRSILRLAERADVHPALRKLWKKHYVVNGEITQHLSPFEQNIVSPMFHNAHEKIFKKVSRFLGEAGPAIVFFGAVYYWAEWKHKDIAFHHRH